MKEKLSKLGAIPVAVIIVVLVVVLANSKTEGTKSVVKESSEAPIQVDLYEYTSQTVSSLGWANEAKNLLSEDVSSGDIYTTVMNTLITTRKAVSKLQKAASILNIYASTTDPLINENVDHYRKVYLVLAFLLEESAKQNEQLLRAQDESGLADFVSNSSKTAVSLDDTWKMLPIVTAETAHLLVDNDRLVDGKVGYLKITSSQRKELIDSLDSTFGTEIRGGLKTGQLAVTASGAMFRTFLTDDWKASDE